MKNLKAHRRLSDQWSRKQPRSHQSVETKAWGKDIGYGPNWMRFYQSGAIYWISTPVNPPSKANQNCCKAMFSNGDCGQYFTYWHAIYISSGYFHLYWPEVGNKWRKRSIPVAINWHDKNNSDLILGDGVPQADCSERAKITHIIERLDSFPKPCPTPNEITGIHGHCTYSISHVLQIRHHSPIIKSSTDDGPVIINNFYTQLGYLFTVCLPVDIYHLRTAFALKIGSGIGHW